MELKYILYYSIKEVELFKVTCEPSTYTVSPVMLKLKQPHIHNSNGDICTGYSCCVNVELCNSVSISMLWQHKISVNQWMEYHKMS